MMSIRSLLVALAAASPALGHLAISSPQPIPGTNSKSPLDPSGSNFPCQGADVASYSGPRTDLTVGKSQPLEFNVGASGENTAVHGGGSCQISLTYETDPSKLKDPSNWKVIHSFLGGCPTNAPGNLGFSKVCAQNGGTDCVNKFAFNIPEEVKDGKAILAWTWFNSIGNREMYMNCAAVNVSGGKNRLSELPSLFVANVASVPGSCTTSERSSVEFPNPGKYKTNTSGGYPLQAPGNCAAGSGSGSGSGSSSPSSSPSPSPSSPAVPSGVASPTVTSAPTAPANTGGAFVETSTKPTTMATSTKAPSPSQPAAPANGKCRSGQITCGSDGFFCISETQFGLCSGGCATPQNVSRGTKCENQSIKHVRSLRFPPQARRA